MKGSVWRRTVRDAVRDDDDYDDDGMMVRM